MPVLVSADPRRPDRQTHQHRGCTNGQPFAYLGSVREHANSVGFLSPAGVRFLRTGKGGLGDRQLMPAVAHMVCHSCGAQSEGPAFSRGTSVMRCVGART
jgi:hypothetical protein